MENIETLLAAAAVAQTQGFGDDDPIVDYTLPERGLEGSESSPAIRDGSEDARQSAVVVVDTPPPAPAFPTAERVIGAGEKRKRGRPPKGQLIAAKPPPPKRNKPVEDEDEDVCFICFDGGSLVLCDRKGCPKAYHPACIKRDEAFFRSKAKWNCEVRLETDPGGTYVVYVRRLRIICVTLAPIHCARDAPKMQIMCVLEETKDFARPA
ncbi:zinc finger CCCH domain-containing protein 44 [Phtheirospermum japonicum]|uniref:Zinc finger CCCH domain-containing protein 44 n=1 Tax=Phtheirospermum japonicum TaxID=374723 RepID=A0A830BML6_9LAMI|nr:zinc finger CCCH domain-containing protein 44 [Phtheirospermum japonicum]